jgi:hypothetical protein
MTYRKGERTNRRREWDYPHSVDIPVPRDGLGDAKLERILTAAQACRYGAECWSHSTQANGEIRRWWSRVGTKTGCDADRVQTALADLGAIRRR